MKRVKQFMAACRAVITPDDKAFVDTWLSDGEQRLFWAMYLPEQYHAINVAYTARKLATAESHVDMALLTRCCLLHDVGKIHGDISTLDKVFIVLLYRFLPNQAYQWQKQGRGGRVRNFRHALYIYKNHPRIGYEKLVQLGLDEIAQIIVHHHSDENEKDGVELRLLRLADEVN